MPSQSAMPRLPSEHFPRAAIVASLAEPAQDENDALNAAVAAARGYMTRYNIACFYSVSNDLDQAFDLLEEILAKAPADMKAWALNDSDFDPLHSDPRWQKVLELAR